MFHIFFQFSGKFYVFISLLDFLPFYPAVSRYYYYYNLISLRLAEYEGQIEIQGSKYFAGIFTWPTSHPVDNTLNTETNHTSKEMSPVYDTKENLKLLSLCNIMAEALPWVSQMEKSA